MERYTQRQLKDLVRRGIAVDLTYSNDRNAIFGQYRQIGYACGVYGCNGKLFQSLANGQLYAITSRTQAIYIF